MVKIRDLKSKTNEIAHRKMAFLRDISDRGIDLEKGEILKILDELFAELEERNSQLDDADRQRRLDYEKVSELRSELTARERYLNEQFNEIKVIRSNLEEQSKDDANRRKQHELDLNKIRHSFDERLNALKQRETEFEEEKLRHEETSKQALQVSSKKFIQDTVEGLTEDKDFYSKSAHRWSMLGGFVIIGVFGTFSYVAISTPEVFDRNVSWQALALYSTKGVVLLSIAALIARYSSMMSQKNLEISRKTSDRIHGIKFGQLYIESYGAAAGWEQLKDAFSSWNSHETPISSEVHNEKSQDEVEKLDAALSKVFGSLEKIRTTIKSE